MLNPKIQSDWKHLFRQAGILHRDISAGNIMAVKKHGVPYGGKLVDFDRARHVNPQSGRPISITPSSDGRTGTIPFLASDLCGQKRHNHFPRWHLPRYDLESFIWVFVWILVRPRVPLSDDTPVQVAAEKYPTRGLHLTKLPHSGQTEHPELDSIANSQTFQPIIPNMSGPPSTPAKPSKRTKHAMPETGKSKNEKWWNNGDLEIVSVLKHAVAESPATQIVDPHSKELMPLMAQLLGLLNQSYKLVKARDEEIYTTTLGRDRKADLAWYEWPGNILTEDSLLSIFETFWENMPDV